MANPLLGEYELELNGISYTLKLTVNVMIQYANKTGSDLQYDAIRAVNAMRSAKPYIDAGRLTDYAEIVLKAVTLEKAAWLIYLAAKEGNSQVEFGEIQEALIVSFDIEKDESFYPAIFTMVSLFCLNGDLTGNKKKDNSSNS